MKNVTKIIAIIGLVGSWAYLNAQNYDEQRTKAQIEKFNDNPRLYYDKIKALTDKIDQANDNTMKISEEYLSIIDKKDSLITQYKNQLKKARQNTGASKSIASDVSSTESEEAPAPKNSTSKAAASTPAQAAKPSSPTEYRVQIAAYKDESMQAFTESHKTFGIQKLDNRSVMEVNGFANADEAHVFAQKMKALGFQGAFVTRYNDGVRQEGPSNQTITIKGTEAAQKTVATSKTSNVGDQLKNEEYPDYIPMGYQELLGDKNKQILQAPKGPPAVKNIPKPLTEYTPNQVDVNEGRATPEGASTAASSVKSTTKTSAPKPQDPKTAAKQTPTAKESAIKKPVKDDPLDEAWQKLFKQ